MYKKTDYTEVSLGKSSNDFSHLGDTVFKIKGLRKPKGLLSNVGVQFCSPSVKRRNNHASPAFTWRRANRTPETKIRKDSSNSTDEKFLMLSKHFDVQKII
uniref:SFRICE_001443 n=1 Tax=Spodoptera frugiperda TaxID=7108 RepID=A0A2H1V0Y5_SPOFR